MRKFLLIVLPIILPFLIYGLYLALARRRARLAGEGDLPGWQNAPWTWIIAASVLLLMASLIAVRELTGFEAGTVLEPTRLEQPEAGTPMPVQ